MKGDEEVVNVYRFISLHNLFVFGPVTVSLFQPLHSLLFVSKGPSDGESIPVWLMCFWKSIDTVREQL